MNDSLLSLLCATVITATAVPAHASGCGGPEFVLDKSTVLTRSHFSETVKGHEIYMTSTVSGPASMKITLYTETLERKGSRGFYWHDLELKSAVPYTLTPSALEAILPITELELVEDHYYIDCGWPSEGSERNLRLIVDYQGQKLEFRTDYVPDAN